MNDTLMAYAWNYGLLKGAIQCALIDLKYGRLMDAEQLLESALQRADAHLFKSQQPKAETTA
jgi:hypothetical protein